MLAQPMLPKSAWFLLAIYFCASLTHFAHNAEYIAFYPNMPQWLTRETVYLAWLVITSVGVAAVVFTCFGLPLLGTILLAAYGALGLDGLGHYTLALCSEHTFATNLTIWFEVAAGLALFLVGSSLAMRRIRARGRRLVKGMDK